MDRHSLFHRNTRTNDRAAKSSDGTVRSDSSALPLACMLSQLVRDYSVHVDASVSQIGISSAHVPLLQFMWDHYDGHTQSAIAESLCVDKGTVSRNVRALVNAGLLSQSCREDDSRACRLALTADGEALRAPVMTAISQWTAKATAMLDAEEARALHALLGRMTASEPAQVAATANPTQERSPIAQSATPELIGAFAPAG